MVTGVPLRDVEGSRHAGRHRGPGVGLDDVANVDEVARLLAIAKDGDRLAAQHLEREDRDHVAVGVEALVGPVDVEVAQAHRLETVEPRVGQACFSSHSLLDP